MKKKILIRFMMALIQKFQERHCSKNKKKLQIFCISICLDNYENSIFSCPMHHCKEILLTEYVKININ